jgi:hypothetical protein
LSSCTSTESRTATTVAERGSPVKAHLADDFAARKFATTRGACSSVAT